MNRKLHNTILAFSVTGVMLVAGLVVAEPPNPAHEALPSAAPALAVDDMDHDDALDAAIDARVRAYEIDLAQADDPAEVLALTAGLIAVTATEAALQSALGELRHDTARRELTQSEPERPRPARRTGNSRDVIAVPYFSFARGSRGSRS